MSIEKSFPVTRVPAKKDENFFKLYIHEIKQRFNVATQETSLKSMVTVFHEL